MELLILFFVMNSFMIWKRVHAGRRTVQIGYAWMWWEVYLPVHRRPVVEGLVSMGSLSHRHHSRVRILTWATWHWIKRTVVVLLLPRWMARPAAVLPLVEHRWVWVPIRIVWLLPIVMRLTHEESFVLLLPAPGVVLR